MSSIRDALDQGTPQTRPIPGREADMVPNSGGGYAFALDDWARLDRFLILGTDGGTFYAGEADLTRENLGVVRRCLDLDGPQTVASIIHVSQGRLAPRNTQAVYALAEAASHKDAYTRRCAEAALPKVCRTGTHLFQFLDFMKLIGGRGWGRGLRRAVAAALDDKDPQLLALHAVKYRQRHGWTYRDALRKAHPKTSDPARRAVYDFMCGRSPEGGQVPILEAFAAAQRGATAAEVAALVRAHDLPWEAVPGDMINQPAVMAALVESMPLTATVRQLARLARLGMLSPMGETERIVTERIADPEVIAGSGVHPVQLLDAFLVHQSGGEVGRSEGAPYTPNQAVLSALEGSFTTAFRNVRPAGKRTYLAIDVSSSMGWYRCAGSAAMYPYQGAAAMALVTAAVEPRCYVAAFSHGGMQGLAVPSAVTLTGMMSALAACRMGPTDCALPMIDADQSAIEVDTFVVYTDNETNVGRLQPSQALKRYRNASGIPARLAVVAMTSTGFSIADPDDSGMLDLVGFSADTPAVLSGFSAGML